VIIYLTNKQNYGQAGLHNHAEEKNKLYNNLAEHNTASQHSIDEGLDKFAHEISREICERERRALWELTDPPKDLKPGTLIPIDSDFGPTLSALQAIEWLKKTATSKCSSFKKTNAERLFEFKLDENNYKLFYAEPNRIGEERRGFVDYKLIRKALNALAEASPEEAKALRDAILYSVHTQINDSLYFVDLMGAARSLRIVQEKGQILYPSTEQMDTFDREISELVQDNIKNHQAVIRKYYPSDIDFSKMNEEEMAASTGYKGIKAGFELDRKEYENVQKMAHKLREFLGRNF